MIQKFIYIFQHLPIIAKNLIILSNDYFVLSFMKTNLSICSITVDFIDCERNSVIKAIEDMVEISKLTNPSCSKVCATLKGVYVSVNSQSDIAETYKKWDKDWHEMMIKKEKCSKEKTPIRGC